MLVPPAFCFLVGLCFAVASLILETLAPKQRSKATLAKRGAVASRALGAAIFGIGCGLRAATPPSALPAVLRFVLFATLGTFGAWYGVDWAERRFVSGDPSLE